MYHYSSTMEEAQVQSARNFLKNKLKINGDEVDMMEIPSACFSTDDKLCVKFATMKDIRTVNSHKINLEDQDTVDDIVPPVLQELKTIFIRKGD